MRTKVVKWGNSLGIIIPKALAEKIQVSEGTEVGLNLENGHLVIRVIPSKSNNLEDLLIGITEKNIHRKIDSGDPVGGENW